MDLLSELGIAAPRDIDIEAIAQHCGATVIYRPLSGCDARIIGVNDSAVITVNSQASRGRQRFSAAHELAHWLRDVGQIALLCDPEQAFDQTSGPNRETCANEFASELLLPRPMFLQHSRGRPMLFNTVSELADLFETSLTATAIRLVELGSFPAILVCMRGDKLWFRRGPDVPTSLWPQAPGKATFAWDVVHGLTTAANGEVFAHEWLSGLGARHRVHEDSKRIGESLVLSLLWWTDEGPLAEIIERDECRDARRSDWREDD
jgi:hypothetical protein